MSYGKSKECAKLTNQPTKHNQHKFNFNLYSTILLHANGITEIKYLHLNPMKNLKFRLYVGMLWLGYNFEYVVPLAEVCRRLLLFLLGISILCALRVKFRVNWAYICSFETVVHRRKVVYVNDDGKNQNTRRIRNKYIYFLVRNVRFLWGKLNRIYRE